MQLLRRVSAGVRGRYLMINWRRVAVIGLMFYIFYTGGCMDQDHDLREEGYSDVR